MRHKSEEILLFDAVLRMEKLISNWKDILYSSSQIYEPTKKELRPTEGKMLGIIEELFDILKKRLGD